MNKIISKKQEEDWAEESWKMPPNNTNASRPVSNKGFGRPRGLRRVFYNQRFNNNSRSDADFKRGKQDGIQRRPYKNSLSDSSDGNGKEEGSYASEQLSHEKDTTMVGSAVSHSESNQTHYHGRDQRYGFPNKCEEDTKRPQQFKSKYRNGRPYQMYKCSNLQVTSELQSITLHDNASADPKSSEPDVKSLSLLSAGVIDDKVVPFPARATLSSAPNFWKDRHAFVNEARPMTEDEEAEMIRRALELSRIEDEERQKRETTEENLFKCLLLESNGSLDKVEDLAESATNETDRVVDERSCDENAVIEEMTRVSSGDDVQDLPVTEDQSDVDKSSLTAIEVSEVNEVAVVDISTPQSCSESGVHHTAEEDSEFGDWMNNLARDSAVDVTFFLNRNSSDTRPQVIYQEVEPDCLIPPDVIYRTPEHHGPSESCRPEIHNFEACCESLSDAPSNEVDDDSVLVPVDSHRNDTPQPSDDSADLVSCSSVHYMPSAASADDFNQYSSPIPPVDVCPSPLRCSSPGPSFYMVDGGPMRFANAPVMPMCAYPPSWVGYPMIPTPPFNPMAMCDGYPYYGNLMPAGPYGLSPRLVMRPPYPPPGLMAPRGMPAAPMGYPGFPPIPPVWFSHGMPVAGYRMVSGPSMSPVFGMAAVETGVEQTDVQNSV